MNLLIGAAFFGIGLALTGSYPSNVIICMFKSVSLLVYVFFLAVGQ
jgi:uncharacterized membrane protein YedE/YeeE